MATSAHEMGDPEQPLPGTVNQQEFQLWDQDQRDAKAEGHLYENEVTEGDDVTEGVPPSAASSDRPDDDAEPKAAKKAAKK